MGFGRSAREVSKDAPRPYYYNATENVTLWERPRDDGDRQRKEVKEVKDTIMKEDDCFVGGVSYGDAVSGTLRDAVERGGVDGERGPRVAVVVRQRWR